MPEKSVIIVANHHTSDITLSRVYKPNPTGDPSLKQISFDAVFIPRGGTARISKEAWEARKNSPGLKYYLDNKILSVVRREGNVNITTGMVVDLESSLNGAPHLKPVSEGEISQPSKDGGRSGENIVGKIKINRRSSVTTDVIEA